MKLTALLSVVPALLLANCQTTASSGSAGGPHPDLPANYRQQIAEFMRTQFFAKMGGIKNAEISEPHRGFAGLINGGGDRDFVCVRFGGPMGHVRGYPFIDGKLPWDNGGVLGGPSSGILTQIMACGDNPVFKPFPEADYQPKA